MPPGRRHARQPVPARVWRRGPTAFHAYLPLHWKYIVGACPAVPCRALPGRRKGENSDGSD